MVVRRIRNSVVLGLCMVWVTALLCADAAAAPIMSCHRHMPCCPISDLGGAHCSAVRCEPQIFQKSEAPQATPPPAPTAGSPLPVLGQLAPAPRELVAGLRCSFSVFQLKDDLRV